MYVIENFSKYFPEKKWNLHPKIKRNLENWILWCNIYLLEQRKKLALNIEKRLKKVWTKIFNILGPLATLWDEVQNIENNGERYQETPWSSSHPEVFLRKCDFNKVTLQFYWNRASAWVFSCKFAAYFQNTFS